METVENLKVDALLAPPNMKIGLYLYILSVNFPTSSHLELLIEDWSCFIGFTSFAPIVLEVLSPPFDFTLSQIDYRKEKLHFQMEYTIG